MNNKRYILDRESTSVGNVWNVYDSKFECIIAVFYNYVKGAEYVEHLNEIA